MSAWTDRLVSRRAAVLGLLAGGAGVAPAAAPVPAAEGNRELESLWADLAKDELTASRALLKLAGKREAVAFLKGKLKPLTIDEKRVRGYLADLASEDEKVWKPAVEELEYFDPRLAIDLGTLMDDVTDRVARARLVALLSGDRSADDLLKSNKPILLRQHGGKNGEDVYFNFFCEGSWWAEAKVGSINKEAGWGNRRKYWTRAVRAVVLLEHIGTPEAAAVLKDLATGHADAQPTRAAKAAVARLAESK
jgi:hypothetical protein